MKTKLICIQFLLSLLIPIEAQVIEVEPIYPSVNDSVEVTLHVNRCDCNLDGYSGEIYAHTGLLTSESNDEGDWKFVIAGWSENLPEARLVKNDDSTYILHINPDISAYYDIDAGTEVESLAFVFRSADGSKQTSNIFYTVYEEGLTLEISQPSGDIVVTAGDTIQVAAKLIALSTPQPDSISLYLDDTLKFSSNSDTLAYEFVAQGIGQHWVRVESFNEAYNAADSFFYFIREEVIIAELPAGLSDGINYIDTTSVTLVLHAPLKNDVFVLGDFNDWQPDNLYLMNKTPDEERFWLEISNLVKGEEYAFQYLVDGNLRIADPYTDKILDPVNDKYLSDYRYPELKTYPYGKTTGIVSTFQTNQQPYEWSDAEFTPAAVTDLIIYELLVRDFSDSGTFNNVIDSLHYLVSLGINAIELMPVSEFEGNESWGYNPSFYFAVDKYYGTKNDYKRFIDTCHQMGIAVIQDIVLNHSYSQSPLVQLYFNEETSQPTDESPWYNQSCPHQPWCWGYDFNHESQPTKTFVHRVNKYWLEEYHVDGFRFDFTKGFTNHIGDGWAYDASRIAILKTMYDSIKSVNPDAYVIFEHLSHNTEETELADYGILLWGKMTDPYNEATMGYHDNNKSDLSGISYQYRGWENPHLVGYMESHDEQRIMFKNITYGNSSGGYNIKEIPTGLSRVEAAANLFFTVPGPKMLWQFGELGYDISIDIPCRVCNKPVLWEYYNVPQRHRLYKVFSALIKLKAENDLFETSDYSLNVTGAMKSLHLNSTGMNATILSSFAMTDNTIAGGFQHTGTWYEFYSGTSIEVTDVNQLIGLHPGEYKLYTDVQLETPDIPVNNESIDEMTPFGIIFPNPSQGTVFLLSPFDGRYQFELFDLAGKRVFYKEGYSSDDVSSTIELNVEGNKLESGLYVFNLKTTAKTFTGKLILE